jgi:tRNA(Ile2) C34 agmatinyltransferase TiaS
MTVAGCQACGHTVESAGERGFFGTSAGRCPSCGGLMLWMTEEDGSELRAGTSGARRLTRAVARVREAAVSLNRPRR